MTDAERKAADLLKKAHALILEAQATLENDDTTEYNWLETIESAADGVWDAMELCQSPTGRDD